MSRIRTTALLTLLSVLPVMAQMDNVIDVEHVYKPEIKDANKISIQPEVVTTIVERSPVDYAVTSVPVKNYAFTPVWAAKGDNAYESAPRRFVTLGGGTEGNILARGAAGFELNEKNIFNIDLGLRGHNATVKRATDSSKEWNSRFYTTTATAGYEYKISSASSILIDAGLESQVFNYQPSEVTEFDTDKQHNTAASFSARLTPLHFGRFSVSVGAGYEFFNQKYRTSLNKSCNEGIITANAALAYSIGKASKVDIDLVFSNASYSKGIDGYSNFALRPHYLWHDGNIEVKAGLYIGNLGIAPDLGFTYHHSPKMDIYADVTGGETASNSFRNITEANPYWALMSDDGADVKMKVQFDQLSTRAGIRFAPIKGFELDINAGYEISKDRMEFDPAPDSYAPVFFADGNRLFINADAAYTFKDRLSLRLANQFNIWSIDDKHIDSEDVLWRPILDLDWSASVRIVGGLRAGADFRLQTFKDKKEYEYTRPATVNLGASLSYTLDCLPLTIYVKGNNLLNQDYDKYFGYKAPGMNILAGAAITF